MRPLEYDCDEYCHWTFPDDNPATAQPSYMMARRLKPFGARAPATGAATGAVAAAETAAAAGDCGPSIMERSQLLLQEDRPPVRPSGKRAAFIKAIEEAEAAEEARKKAWADSAWHVVPEDTPFKKEAERLSVEPRYLRDLNAGRLKGLQLSSFLKAATWLQIKPMEEVTPLQAAAKPTPSHLVNRVVQIDGEDDYEYWYVLTYLPDLQWCHVAPLEKRGTFSDKPGPRYHHPAFEPRARARALARVVAPRLTRVSRAFERRDRAPLSPLSHAHAHAPTRLSRAFDSRPAADTWPRTGRAGCWSARRRAVKSMSVPAGYAPPHGYNPTDRTPRIEPHGSSPTDRTPRI